jgi:hypothetical protein
MHADDIRDGGDNGCQMPNLCRAVQAAGVLENSWAVAEVVGQVSGQPVAEYITQACKERQVQGATVERVELRHLPPVAPGENSEEERRDILGDNGTFLPSKERQRRTADAVEQTMSWASCSRPLTRITLSYSCPIRTNSRHISPSFLSPCIWT